MDEKLSTLLDRIYSIPNPYRSLEQHERFTHSDLKQLSKGELLKERERLRIRLVLDDAPDKWLLRRWDKLEEILG